MGFIAALLGQGRPIHEMLNPNFQDQKEIFENQFSGMTRRPYSYNDFETTREMLVEKIHSMLTNTDREFMISFKTGSPEWSLYPLQGLEKMPAVKWKLLNINRLLNDQPAKHSDQLEALRKCLGAN